MCAKQYLKRGGICSFDLTFETPSKLDFIHFRLPQGEAFRHNGSSCSDFLNITCFSRSVKSQFDFASLGGSLDRESLKMDKVELSSSIFDRLDQARCKIVWRKFLNMRECCMSHFLEIDFTRTNFEHEVGELCWVVGIESKAIDAIKH